MHRRSFLTSSIALLAGSSLAARSKPATIGLGMQTYTFRNFNLERTLQFMQKLDLHEAEFFSKHISQTATAEQIAAFLKLCGSYNVKPVAFGVQHFSKKHDANRKFFDFGKALGIRVFSADPDPDSFDSLDKLCDEYKIAIAIHPHGPSGGKMHRWYSADIIMKAVKDHHPLIGSCLDTGHLIRSAQMGHNLDPATEIRIMGKRNFGLHLKDHDNARKTDVVCGKGVLDVKSVFKALREVGFDYSVSLEYEASPDNPYEEVAACVAVMKNANA
ncbi:MAG: sugar phosphate isomerase/epimerase [Gemmatales bacterium]